MIDFEADTGNARGGIAHGHFTSMAEETEAGDIGNGVDDFRAELRFDIMQSFGPGAIELRHGSNGRVDGFPAGTILLNGRRNHAGADGFGEKKDVICRRADISPNLQRIDDPADGITELNVLIANGVAADDGALRFTHFVQAAANDLFKDRGVAFFGKANEGECGEGATAHGVNITKGIGGSNLAESERVVDDGREEIDGLDEADRLPE